MANTLLAEKNAPTVNTIFTSYMLLNLHKYMRINIIGMVLEHGNISTMVELWLIQTGSMERSSNGDIFGHEHQK
jgi:hypothetical protein